MSANLNQQSRYWEGVSNKYIFEVYTNCMKNLSLKLDDEVFTETEKITDMLKVPRNRYINAALAFYNAHNARLLLKKNLAKESILVRANSMEVLKEMELLEDDIEY
jgi:hypothetical protein